MAVSSVSVHQSNDVIERSPALCSMERFGADLLGIGSIAMIVPVPVLLAALLLYLAFKLHCSHSSRGACVAHFSTINAPCAIDIPADDSSKGVGAACPKVEPSAGTNPRGALVRLRTSNRTGSTALHRDVGSWLALQGAEVRANHLVASARFAPA